MTRVRGVVSPDLGGDVSRLHGDNGGLSGDVTPLHGSATGVFGDIDACGLEGEAPGSVDIAWLVATPEIEEADERDDSPSPGT